MSAFLKSFFKTRILGMPLGNTKEDDWESRDRQETSSSVISGDSATRSSFLLSSSPAIGSDGTVYVWSGDKKLYAINGKSGVKLWEFETGVPPRINP